MSVHMDHMGKSGVYKCISAHYSVERVEALCVYIYIYMYGVQGFGVHWVCRVCKIFIRWRKSSSISSLSVSCMCLGFRGRPLASRSCRWTCACQYVTGPGAVLLGGSWAVRRGTITLIISPAPKSTYEFIVPLE